MGRRSALLVTGLLLLAVAGCGDDGGGGDEDAFCDALDNLSEQVADGDLASDDGLEDATDTANELLEASSSDQEEAVTEVGETLADADPDDAEETAEVVEDELGDFAEDCDIDDFAEAPEATTTTEPGEDTTTTDGGGGDTTTSVFVPTDDVAVGPRVEIPADLEAEFLDLADLCFRGDFASCDQLFNETPAGSVAEAYGDTCAGRIQDGGGFDFECISLVAAAFPPPDDVIDTANADACFNGDMNACDALLAGGDDSPDAPYGFFCGGRLNEQVVADAALCADIFGPVAEFG